jgi:peptidoglycan/xylan/chitin deacetylase (PgdA/CDA1 family)
MRWSPRAIDAEAGVRSVLPDEPRLLLVNYHYVRDPALYPYPGIHPLARKDFEHQLQQLSGRYHMASPAEAQAFVLDQEPLPRDSVLLTFDDGLVDHAVVAREILDPMGIKGAFFVCTRPLSDGRALSVHKVHWLRATTEPDAFASAFEAALPPNWRERRLTDEEAAAAHATYVYDEERHRRLKYLINFVLPEEVVDDVTSRMLAARGIDERRFCTDTYMGPAALQELESNGHLVGAHTHDHRPVTRSGTEGPALMAKHRQVLGSILGRAPIWFSYPFGRDWALPDDREAFARENGFAVALTLQDGWVTRQSRPYELPRINTNEVARTCGFGT